MRQRPILPLQKNRKSRISDLAGKKTGKNESIHSESSIKEKLWAFRDEKYAAFTAKLIPEASLAHFIGVRTPDLRNLAKELAGSDSAEAFIGELPHEYFEEDQLHAFLISLEKDYDSCMEKVCAFLPYVDNWATCDQMGPKVFGKKGNREALLRQIKLWIKSKKTYEVRFGIRMLMCHFLDDGFDPKYLDMVAKIKSDEYYINMMIAWYFATALAKQYDASVKLLKARVLPPWVQNKSIQKAVESYRITDEQKVYLRTLKIPSGKEKNKEKSGKK